MDSVAPILFATAAVLVAVSMTVLVCRRRFGSLDVKLGSVVARIQAVHEDVEHINNAVNNQPAHAPVLVDRVRSIEATIEWLAAAVHRFSDHLGTELPPRPAVTRPQRPARERHRQ